MKGETSSHTYGWTVRGSGASISRSRRRSLRAPLTSPPAIWPSTPSPAVSSSAYTPPTTAGSSSSPGGSHSSEAALSWEPLASAAARANRITSSPRQEPKLSEPALRPPRPCERSWVAIFARERSARGGHTQMAGNKAVAYIGPGKVEVQSIDYPKLELRDGPGVNPKNVGRKCEHGVILKVVSTNICGSDQHMVRGRTTAPMGLVLGHEITGEVVETGRDVEFIKKGDLVSVPFNIACGRCRNCKEGKTGICLNVNPARPGAAYGYVDMGGWVGGQAQYVMVPYADFKLLKFPEKDQAMAKIKDLTLLSDIFPTGYHGAV